MTPRIDIRLDISVQDLYKIELAANVAPRSIDIARLFDADVSSCDEIVPIVLTNHEEEGPLVAYTGMWNGSEFDTDPESIKSQGDEMNPHTAKALLKFLAEFPTW